MIVARTIALVILGSLVAAAALVPPFFLDCVVAIGHDEIQVDTGGRPAPTWVTEASGFFYGEFASKVDDKLNNYRIFLVTNRHVIQNHNEIVVRVNPKAAGRAKEYHLPLNDPQGRPAWYGHPDSTVDLIVIPINAQHLKDEGIQFNFFQSDQHVADRTKAKELGLSAGDGVFFLGFPMGLAGGERNYVIVRQGCIARIEDVLNVSSTNTFLIDGFTFPGNSGGPVVLAVSLNSIEGTQSQNRSYLIGVVKGFLGYQDIAFSKQTGRPRITFEENAGLTEVIPVDYVEQTVQVAMKATAGQPGN